MLIKTGTLRTGWAERPPVWGIPLPPGTMLVPFAGSLRMPMVDGDFGCGCLRNTLVGAIWSPSNAHRCLGRRQGGFGSQTNAVNQCLGGGSSGHIHARHRRHERPCKGVLVL